MQKQQQQQERGLSAASTAHQPSPAYANSDNKNSKGSGAMTSVVPPSLSSETRLHSPSTQVMTQQPLLSTLPHIDEAANSVNKKLPTQHQTHEESVHPTDRDATAPQHISKPSVQPSLTPQPLDGTYQSQPLIRHQFQQYDATSSNISSPIYSPTPQLRPAAPRQYQVPSAWDLPSQLPGTQSSMRTQEYHTPSPSNSFCTSPLNQQQFT